MRLRGEGKRKMEAGAAAEGGVFGDDNFVRMNGAGGQNRTGYARLFRAALYQ
jgi:hypothetical protein